MLLLELLLLDPDLLAPLPLFALELPLLLDPPELELDLAMLALLPAAHNRQTQATVPGGVGEVDRRKVVVPLLFLQNI